MPPMSPVTFLMGNGLSTLDLVLSQCKTEQMNLSRCKSQQRVSGSVDNLPNVLRVSGGCIFEVCAAVWRALLLH